MTISRVPRPGSSSGTPGRRAIFALLVLILPVACSEHATSAPRGDRDQESTLGVIVSAPVQPVLSASIGSSRAGVGPSAILGAVAFVSLPPNSVPSGFTASVRNARNSESITLPMTDGGLDPTAIRANVGDELAITVGDSVVLNCRSTDIHLLKES